MTEDYRAIEGYNPDADLGLGCGLPTEFEKIKKGDVVIDLGSGAGFDVFLAARKVGPSGTAIGIDMSKVRLPSLTHFSSWSSTSHPSSRICLLVPASTLLNPTSQIPNSLYHSSPILIYRQT